MAALVALARNALTPGTVANISADPCDLAAASSPSDEWQQAVVDLLTSTTPTASGARFRCNAARRIEGIMLHPWHMSTNGELLNTEYLTSSNWAAQQLSNLKYLVITGQDVNKYSPDIRLQHKLPAVSCGESRAKSLRLTVPLLPRQVAQVAPTLVYFGTGDSLEQNRLLSADITYSQTLKDSYERPDYEHQISSELAFPEGLADVCRLQHLQGLWVSSLAEASVLARRLSLWFVMSSNGSTARQVQGSTGLGAFDFNTVPQLDDGWRLATNGSSGVTGEDILPGCLSQLSALTLLLLHHTTTLPLRLPAAWGRLQMLRYLSITTHGERRCEHSDEQLASTAAPAGNVTSMFGCGLALPPKGYGAWLSHCQARDDDHSLNTSGSRNRSPDCLHNSCHNEHQVLCMFTGRRFGGCRNCAVGSVWDALSGTLPAEYAGMSSLRTLRLSRHNLSGTLPAGWATGMVALNDLELHSNKLHGLLPKQWLQAPPPSGSSSKQHWAATLKVLNLGCNQLTGQLPTNLSRFSDLHILMLDSNQLSGQVPFVLPASLQYLHLNDNDFTGPLRCFQRPVRNSSRSNIVDDAIDLQPLGPSHGSALALRSVNLGDNKLSGTLPPCLSATRDSATPNLLKLVLKYQRADPSRVNATYAAVLQELGISGCGHSRAEQLGSNVTAPGAPDSRQLCQAAEAAAATAALSKLSIHGTIPPALMTIKVLDLNGLSLSGPLPEPFCRGPSHVSGGCDQVARDRQEERGLDNVGGLTARGRVQVVAASNQLTGGFEPSASAAWLATGCSTYDIASFGKFSFKLQQQQHNRTGVLARGLGDDLTITIQYGKDSSKQHLESITWSPPGISVDALDYSYGSSFGG
jgi:Leucine-rich repeat (LRR) protein